MGHVENLIAGGLTNHYSGDHWELATSKVGYPYDHYCTSSKCCTGVVGHKEALNRKTKQMEKVTIYKTTDYILKFKSPVQRSKCPDCGHFLIVERSKTKIVEEDL